MLEGSAVIEPPAWNGDEGLQWILEHHTDLLSARNSVLRSQFELRLAQVTPIPDIYTGTTIQHDNSSGNNQVNLQVGIQLPLFDRNQGNIRASRGRLAEAIEVVKVRQNDLASQFAETDARYQTNKALVANYRDKVLPNLARVYKATYQRYQQEPLKVSFNDIVVAQLNLGQALNAYLQGLSDQWRGRRAWRFAATRRFVSNAARCEEALRMAASAGIPLDASNASATRSRRSARVRDTSAASLVPS